MAQFWLSFVGEDDGFRGACLVDGDLADAKAALHYATGLGLNPGGEVLIVAVEKKNEWRGSGYTNKLFTDKVEINRVFGAASALDKLTEGLASGGPSLGLVSEEK